MKKIFLLIALTVQGCVGNFIIKNESDKYIRCFIDEDWTTKYGEHYQEIYDLAPGAFIRIYDEHVDWIDVRHYEKISEDCLHKFRLDGAIKIYNKDEHLGKFTFSGVSHWNFKNDSKSKQILIDSKKYLPTITINYDPLNDIMIFESNTHQHLQQSIEKAKQEKFPEEAAHLKEQIKTAMPQLPNYQLPDGILGIISEYALEQKEDYEK